jgi:3-oxoadipate enol-lactonase
LEFEKMVDGTNKSLNGIGYSVYGDADQTVLLLHPAFANRHAFDGQLEALGRLYRVITVDLPGHGESRGLSKGVRPVPTMANVATTLAAILDEERVEHVHAVGVSVGSLVAQDMARRFPDRVQSLAVIGGYNVTDTGAAKAQSTEMRKWLPMLLFRLDGFRRYLVEQSVATSDGQARFAELVADFRRRSLMSMRGVDQIVTDKRMDSLQCPLWIAFGELDHPAVRAAAQRWVAENPTATVTEYPGVGHCINLDAPEVFNRDLLDWIARNSP